jgi:RHS repeat-associated protein
MRKDSSPKVVRPFDAGSRYQKTEAERRSKAEHLGTTFYGWDGDRLAWESTEESCTHYLYEPGSFAPIAQARSDKPIQLHRTPDWTGKAYKFSEDPLWQESPQPHPFSQMVFYHCDQIGTPQEMTDEEGEIAWQAQYKAWGEAKVTVEKIRNPLRFQGQYFDHETGLHYNRFRYYDPEIGRYLSKDPIGFAGGLNLHAYVANPTQGVDPLGLQETPPNMDDVMCKNAGLPAWCPKPDVRPDGRPWGAGCGDAKTDKYVPDSYSGIVSFEESCNIHDQCYGTPGADKEYCDKQFGSNLKQACDADLGGQEDDGKLKQLLLYRERMNCHAMADWYEFSVRKWGGSAFENAQKEAGTPQKGTQTETTSSSDSNIYVNPNLGIGDFFSNPPRW